MHRFQIAFLFLLSGCSKATDEPTPVASTTASLALTSPATVDPKAGAKTAVAFMTALQEQTTALDVRAPIARYNGETDPNHMLGRQHGYVEKIAFGAAGGDGSLEVFPNLADAKARQAYIDEISKGSPMLGDGYDYLNEKRFALLRLPRETTPAQATQWAALLAAL